MLCRIIYVLCVLFVLSNAQRGGRRNRWDAPELDKEIDIDSETDNTFIIDQVVGSGSGLDDIDDEDLQTSGSGSGHGVLPDTKEDDDYMPKANAGSDVVKYLPDNMLTLCGYGSRDDKGIKSYYWFKHRDSPYAELEEERTVCVKVKGLQVGEYFFTLVVADTAGQKSSDDVKVTVKPEVAPLSECQQFRESSKHILGIYVPRCKEDGSYDSLQCRGHQGTGICWCVDTSGREIPGTAKSPPGIPDCEQGSNLPPCVYSLVLQHRGRQVGSFRPRCTLDGYFMDVQCTGSVCYCVDRESGVKVTGTEVLKGVGDPVCDGSMGLPSLKDVDGGSSMVEGAIPPGLTTTTIPSTSTTTTTRLGTPAPQPDITTKINIIIGGGQNQGDPTESNDTGDQKEPEREVASPAHLMTQPGILAAVIGGSVVLLLCAILLVMFIVYRMRKKDEGSYALDEPKKVPNYSYQRAPDKEFYA